MKIGSVKSYLDYLSSKNELLKPIINRLRLKEEVPLEVLLNALFNMDNDNEDTIEVMFSKTHDNLVAAKESFSKITTGKEAIYIIGTDKEDLDKIAYWEMGHLMAKGVKVVGYCNNESGKENIKICKNVRECLGFPLAEDVHSSLGNVIAAVESIGYYIPSSNLWNDLCDDARREEEGGIV